MLILYTALINDPLNVTSEGFCDQISSIREQPEREGGGI